jgi:Domain of unknown function (DUF4184)
MPFTFSHPAIVLPLKLLPDKWFSMTGLIAGSLTPDFEYFIRMRIYSEYSHTISGIFWLDLPIGMLLTFIFHNIVRDQLFDNLPGFLQSRLSVFKQLNWNNYFRANWFVVLISLFTGIASHLFWDSFTHPQGYFVHVIPALTNEIQIAGMTMQNLKIIQHTSTLLGGIIITYALFKLPKSIDIKHEISLHYWMIIVVLAFVIIAIRFFTGLDYKLYGNVITTGISAGLIALILTPIFMKMKLIK